MQAVTPVVVMFESTLTGLYPSRRGVGAVALLCLGVALATVTDYTLWTNLLGLAVAAAAVLCTATYLVVFSFALFCH